MSCFLAVMRFPFEICSVLLHTFLTRFSNETSCFLAVMRCPFEIPCFLAAAVERWIVHDGLLDVVWFCVCKLGGSLAGEMNVSFVVVVGGSASALRDAREMNVSFVAGEMNVSFVKGL